nr:MAG TPA: hypothetical protein [Inoviridae sp.]
MWHNCSPVSLLKLAVFFNQTREMITETFCHRVVSL